MYEGGSETVDEYILRSWGKSIINIQTSKIGKKEIFGL